MATTMQSEVAVLRRALLKQPRAAWTSGEEIDRQWEALDYLARPDLPRAMQEFDALVSLLESRQIEVELLPAEPNTGLDSIYARDATIVCNRGVILCRMGKAARETEPSAQEAALRRLGLPILGAIGGSGTLEGGDVTWLDSESVAVGRGYRTNSGGIGQLRSILEGEGDVEVIEVALPHWRGPGDVFHLMSIMSPVDLDLALVYSPLMSVPFRELLLSRGIELVEVPAEEYDSMAGNVLTIAPRVCVQLSGNPVTRERLERAGVEVLTFEGEEICGKGCGGPTCLTRSLERES